MEDLDFCPGLHLDGPLSGTTGYAINRIGARVTFFLPPTPGGPRGVYEVVQLADGERPAGLRFIGYIEDRLAEADRRGDHASS